MYAKVSYLNSGPLWGNTFIFDLISAQQDNNLQLLANRQAVETGQYSDRIGFKTSPSFRTLPSPTLELISNDFMSKRAYGNFRFEPRL